MSGPFDTSEESIDYLAGAIAIASSNARNGLGGPFGAIIVTFDGFIVPGAAAVASQNDPTAHAEIVAIRNACELTKSFDLTGATLYSSCAPCPMCLGAAQWARVDHIVYAAQPGDAHAAGFDDAKFYYAMGVAAGHWGERDRSDTNPQLLTQVDHPLRLEPFDLWTNLPEESRTEY